jgi:very-short-patch-repair endonuclease
MRPAIDEVLRRLDGAASRAQLRTVVSRNELDDEVRRGRLIALFPRAYCRPWDADQPSVRARAAVASVGWPVALSHLTGLRVYDLAAPDTDTVHVTTTVQRHPVGRVPRLVVHRTRVPTPVRQIRGLPVVAPALAVVRSWPLVAGPDRRAAAIAACRNGLVTPSELAAAADRAIGMPGRTELIALIDLLAAGCESELEIWGYLGVFNVPGLDHAKRQLRVTIGRTRYRLDQAYEEEQVAVELDGDRYHAGRDRREYDRRRDAALAAAGWLTLRFSHERLHHDVAGCRRDTLATLAARRAWRRSG